MKKLINEKTGEVFLCNEPSDYVKPKQYLKMTYEERLELYRNHKSNFDDLAKITTERKG
ncbi:MAG: hypothetical protein NC177_17705 [Ruminococcus flavefaciens]|nr:hypothetical protein [Ruminococcus flavefaciens]